MGNSDSTALLRGIVQSLTDKEINNDNPIVFDTIWSLPSSQHVCIIIII